MIQVDENHFANSSFETPSPDGECQSEKAERAVRNTAVASPDRKLQIRVSSLPLRESPDGAGRRLRPRGDAAAPRVDRYFSSLTARWCRRLRSFEAPVPLTTRPTVAELINKDLSRRLKTDNSPCLHLKDVIYESPSL